jgi:hypothetical protein
MWQSRVNLIIGIWLILTGIIQALQTPVNMIITGLAAILFGLWIGIKIKSWEGILNGFIGVWILLCGALLNFNLSWNYFVFGGIIIVFAIWTLTEHNSIKNSSN